MQFPVPICTRQNFPWHMDCLPSPRIYIYTSLHHYLQLLKPHTFFTVKGSLGFQLNHHHKETPRDGKKQKVAALDRTRITSTRSNDKRSASVPSSGHLFVYSANGKRFIVPLKYMTTCITRELQKMSEEKFGLPSDGLITHTHTRTRAHTHTHSLSLSLSLSLSERERVFV